MARWRWWREKGEGEAAGWGEERVKRSGKGDGGDALRVFCLIQCDLCGRHASFSADEE